MKKIKMIMVYLLFVAIAWTHTGCFGTFALTNKAWEFNKNVGGKAAQEIVFLVMVILPVYEVCTFVDAIVLNTVEFWSGTNPLTMKAGEKDTHSMVMKGVNYRVTAMQNKFIVEKQQGNSFIPVGTLEYKNKTWYSNTENKEHKLVGYNSKGQVVVYSKDNKIYTMDRSVASSDQLRKLVNAESVASR